MGVILKIDRALYEVDNERKAYRYSGRNPDWQKLTLEENERNKKRINGYTRRFRDGTTKTFKYPGKPGTKRAIDLGR